MIISNHPQQLSVLTTPIPGENWPRRKTKASRIVLSATTAVPPLPAASQCPRVPNRFCREGHSPATTFASARRKSFAYSVRICRQKYKVLQNKYSTNYFRRTVPSSTSHFSTDLTLSAHNALFFSLCALCFIIFAHNFKGFPRMSSILLFYGFFAIKHNLNLKLMHKSFISFAFVLFEIIFNKKKLLKQNKHLFIELKFQKSIIKNFKCYSMEKRWQKYIIYKN